ncbi:MAG: hypothetical protein EP343_29240 [Deltaproteobacteria bacterium]|nr:MAG: hypothetical protein EP343_29240 [Deltaproteobacteria bacterium]
MMFRCMLPLGWVRWKSLGRLGRCGCSFVGLVSLLGGSCFADAAPSTRPTTAPTKSADRRKQVTLQKRRIPVSASKVVLVLEEGSCWGGSKKQKTVVVKKDHVLIHTPKKSPFRRSLSWWKTILVRLNKGVARSQPMPKPNQATSCNAGNWFCGYWIKVTEGKKVTSWQGCCRLKNRGQQVDRSFWKLQPNVQPKPRKRKD